MSFSLEEIRFERMDIDMAYHAAFTFFGLKGVLMERWGHGPIFGAYGETGTTQIQLTPTSGEGDEKIAAVAGLRASGLVGEGPNWARRAPEIAVDWLEDVYAVLKPKRTVLVRVEVFGLHPVTNPTRASKRLLDHYYKPAALESLPSLTLQHAAVDTFNLEEDGGTRSMIMGVTGPAHRGLFTFADKTRDSKWWMGLKLVYSRNSEDGIDEPIDFLKTYLERAPREFESIARAAFPQLVSD